MLGPANTCMMYLQSVVEKYIQELYVITYIHLYSTRNADGLSAAALLKKIRK